VSPWVNAQTKNRAYSLFKCHGRKPVGIYVIEMEPSISDDEVIQRASEESALLLTADKDFGELIFRQGRIVYGVVLIRLAGLSPQHKAEVVAAAIQQHADELARNFTVIRPGAVRIRRRDSSGG